MKIREILLVEDSEGDILLTRQALSLAMDTPVKLEVARDGQEAIDMLATRGPGQSLPFPDLILLDLNLPLLKGQEVLKLIRSQKRTQFLPIIVLSNDSNDKDIQHCYELGANGYLIKPVTFDEFVDMLRKLSQFWFHANMLPGGGEG